LLQVGEGILKEFTYRVPVSGFYHGRILTTVKFYFFKDIKKYGAELVWGVPGQLNNIFEKILSQESMR
jgi:hypothetical protein